MKTETLKIEIDSSQARQEIAELGQSLESIKPPLWRVQTIRALQMLGTAAAFIGGADFTPWVSLLSPEHALVLLAVGAYARMEAPQIINFIGDLTDNGRLDGSFRQGMGNTLSLLFLAMAALGMGLLLTGCGMTMEPPDKQGCYLLTTVKSGKAYSAGPCVDETGVVYAYRSAWTNGDGVRLRTTYTIATKSSRIEYSEDGILWIGWSSKSGISLDGAGDSSEAQTYEQERSDSGGVFQ